MLICVFSGVGKSCLLLQFTDKRFQPVHDLTIGMYNMFNFVYPTPLLYCDVPGSPFLSKMGPVYGPFFFLKILGRFSPPVNGPKDPWPRVLSLPGARMVCWRPYSAGT